MLLRLSFFALFQLMAALLGWWWLRWPGAALGLLAGSLAAMALDTWRAHRYLAWLRQPADAAAAGVLPVVHGPWGEAAYRTSRALRASQHQAQENAQRLQDFLAAIQALPNGVVLLDPEGRIEWCNHIATQHFGIDPQRDLLQHVGNLVREPAFAAYYAARQFAQDVRMPGRTDAPGHPVRLSVQLYPYGSGHQLMLSLDITALAQADAMRRDFVANVSHEIRTPLTVLAGFVETLQNLPLPEAERAHYLGLMAAQAARMQTLVNDLLTLSRLEGSPLPRPDEVIDLPALWVQCEAEARALSSLLHPDKPQQLVFAPLPGWRLTGSATEMRSAVANLIQNAVRYTPAGGRIEAQWTRLPDGRARFAVTDTGCGIAPEHVPRLGERFYRVDRSRSRESGGTGLGLAIAKHVAQRHAGELQISSTLGQGSCFALVFAAHRVREASPPGAQAA